MKKFLTFLALACFMVAGAWAQTIVQEPKTGDGYTYTIHCAALDGHNTHPYLSVTGTTINAQDYEANATRFKFDSPAAGQYRIIDVASGKYLEVGSSASLVDTPTMYWTLSPQADGVRFLANGTNGQFMNNNGALALRGGTGGCSSWVLTEYSSVTETYTVNITGAPSAVKITYKGNEYGNEEQFEATGLIVTDITVEKIAGYDVNVAIDGTNINVTYTEISLTDPITYGALGTSATESWALVSSAAAGLLNPTGATYTVTLENLRVLERTVNVAESGVLASTFMYKGGNHRIDIAGVEVVDGSGNIVSSDYHFGYSGGQKVGNTYNVFTPAGQYTFRYYAIYSSGSYDTKGEITNVFTPQTKEDYDLQALISEAEALYNANSEPQTGKNLITQDSQFSSPFTGEGNTNTLLDGNLGTYWHSSWQGGDVEFHKHYLQVELAEAIDGTLQLTMGRRSGAANDHPVKMTVEYSADGTNYTLLTDQYLEFSATSGYVKDTFTLPTAAKYLRFFNEESNGTYQRGYWHCSEFQLNTISTSLNETYPTDAANMLAAINTAKGVSTATQNDVNTLQAALNAYKNAAAPTYIVTITGAPEGTKISYKGNKYADGDTFKAESVSATDINPDALDYYTALVNISGSNIVVSYQPCGIKTMTEIEQGQAYTITAGGSRGAFIVNDGKLTSTNKVSVTPDATDPYQQFLFVLKDGNYYLYNIGAERFISIDGDYTACNTKPEETEIEFIENQHSSKATNPVVLQMDGCHLGVSNSYNPAVIAFWNSTNDEGNSLRIMPVEATVDMDAVLAKFTAPDWAGLAELVATVKSYPVGTGLSKYSWVVDNEDCTAEWEDNVAFFEDYVKAQVGEADEVEVMKEALNGAIDQLVLNMPKPNTFIRIKDADGHYMTCDNNSNKTVFSDTKDVKSIYLYTENALIAYSNGYYASRYSNKPCGMTQATTPSEGTLYHVHASSLNKSKYLISFGGDTRFMYKGADAGNYAGGPTAVNNAGYEFTLEEVTELPVTVTSAGYATLYAPVNLTIPTGVKAYGMTVANEKYLSPEEIDTTIPANTGVVLEAAADTYNFAITETAGSATSDLTGTYATIASAETDGNYVFSIKDGTPGFYKFVGSELKGFKAYYQTSVASINGFSIDFGGQIVGVNSVISATNLKAGYDIQGRRINKIQKGINILNGKKIIK